MNNTVPPPLSMIAANLLRNSCFLPGYLINQRGVASGSISNSSSYFIDAWMTYQSALNNLTYTFAPSGLRIAVSTGSGGIGQRLEFALETGKSYTLAAQIDGVVYALQITGGTSCNQNVTSTTALAYVTDYGGYNAVRVYFTGVTARVITWVVLYEGAYTDNTLPPYVPPDPAAELVKCQRYFIAYESNREFTMISTGVTNGDASGLYCPLHFPVPMRAGANPTILYNDIGLFGVYNGGNYTPVNITIYSRDTSPGGCKYVVLRAHVAGLNLTPRAVYQLNLKAGARLTFSREL